MPHFPRSVASSAAPVATREGEEGGNQSMDREGRRRSGKQHLFGSHGREGGVFTAQPVELTNTGKMLHRNFNCIVGVLKTAINMLKELKL